MLCDHPRTVVSLFDGIGGFPLAFASTGAETVATVEIDKAAAGVAADHFPNAKHFADVTEVTADDLLAAGFCPVCGVLTGGWPCQDLSLAGRRLGLGGARSGLFFEIVRLARGLRPRWLVLENVPGLLSAVCSCPGGGRCEGTKRRDPDTLRVVRVPCDEPHGVSGGDCGRRRRIRGGRLVGRGRCMELHGGAMGAVLGSLAELGYGFAYRVLDARHFGVPQRRRRVVVVGCCGDWAAPAAVLLEPESCAGDSAQSGPPRAGATGGTAGGTGNAGVAVNALTSNMAGGGGGADDNTAQGGHLVAYAVTAREGKGPDPDTTSGNIVTHALTSEGADASEDGTGRGTPLVPTAFDWQSDGERTQGNISTERTSTLGTTNRDAVAYALRRDPGGTGQGHNTNYVPERAADSVRRLTPVECERLQGYPDGWTTTSNGRPQADSARYRQLGNSIAVPVFAWVARRLTTYEDQEGTAYRANPTF